MIIKIKITRDENAAYFGVSPGNIVSMELETYVAGVVASEIGNSAVEACRAQAVAARTFAVSKGVLKGTAISDASSSDQAYRATRIGSGLYPNAEQGAKDTKGEILTYNGSPINAVYSASNGGKTVSSKERWGSVRPYLIAQDDPWDNSTKAAGHGVGMSQRGAKAMAKAGMTYGEILAFYYPGTKIGKIPEPETDQTKRGGCMISAEAFVEKAKIPLAEGWGYIYGTHGVVWTKEKQAVATREQTINYGSQWVGKMVTDCSGLIYWACLELGEKVVHHATYLYTDWCRPKGKLVNITASAAGETKGRDDGQPIRPGTLVFIKGTQEKIHHTGVYIGDDTVIEAKGTKSGVVTSRLSHWEYWGELKVIDYTNGQQKSEPKKDVKPDMTVRAKATNPHTWLNVRQVPNGQLVFKVQKGTIVDVLDSTTNGEWWQISCNGRTGWAKSEFLTIKEDEIPEPQQEVPVADTIPEENEWPEPQDVWPEEQLPFEKPAASVSKGDILGALKSISADLAIMTRLVNDAQKAPDAEGLIEILNAMDKVLTQVQAAQKEMWRLFTVG